MLVNQRSFLHFCPEKLTAEINDEGDNVDNLNVFLKVSHMALEVIAAKRSDMISSLTQRWIKLSAFWYFLSQSDMLREGLGVLPEIMSQISHLLKRSSMQTFQVCQFAEPYKSGTW
jgi:hypothetical protein